MKKVNVMVSLDMDLLEEDYDWLKRTDGKKNLVNVLRLMHDMIHEQNPEVRINFFDNETDENINPIKTKLPFADISEIILG